VTVRIEKDGHVWTVVLARPQARNAVDPESAAALYEAFQTYDADDEARVAVFWGEGGAFCAGYDLKRAATLGGADALDAHDFPQSGEPPYAPMGPSRLDLSKPVIAAVAGPAVAGGMELAMWADIRVMEETAYMGVFCRRWGVPLIDGGTVRLPRLVGEGRAMDLILTGRRVEAREALAIGLCEYVVPEGAARDRAEELARQIAAFPAKLHAGGSPLGARPARVWQSARPCAGSGGTARTNCRRAASRARAVSPAAPAAAAALAGIEEERTRGEGLVREGRPDRPHNAEPAGGDERH
jgi:enoyl-CoA hydratase